MYFIYALTDLPKLKDKFILDKLYTILFSRLASILQMLTEIHETLDTNVFFSNDLTFTNDVPYLLHQDFIIQMRDKASELEVEVYLDSLIDVVWRIGYDIFKKRAPYTELNVLDVEEFKNWREYLEIDLTKSKYYISYQPWCPSEKRVAEI